jgi:hypothetical protein
LVEDKLYDIFDILIPRALWPRWEDMHLDIF